MMSLPTLLFSVFNNTNQRPAVIFACLHPSVTFSLINYHPSLSTLPCFSSADGDAEVPRLFCKHVHILISHNIS